jgi:hypothetical protein
MIVSPANLKHSLAFRGVSAASVGRKTCAGHPTRPPAVCRDACPEEIPISEPPHKSAFAQWRGSRGTEHGQARRRRRRLSCWAPAGAPEGLRGFGNDTVIQEGVLSYK